MKYIEVTFTMDDTGVFRDMLVDTLGNEGPYESFVETKDGLKAYVQAAEFLNRCDSDKWRSWAGDTPYKQVIRAGQFEVYFGGGYQKYMPGGSYYGDEKYNIARQAVLDGLNGIRNNQYLGFRAWWISSYSDKYIVSGGNRYGYN